VAACCGGCGPTQVCTNGQCGCGAGTKPCQGGCIADAACCEGCPSGQDCRAGSCCYATSPTLQAALTAGPDTIHLCPNTTYPGTFTIARDVTVIGAGDTSSVLDGNGSGPVITVTSAVTGAQLRTLGIRGGLRTGVAERGAGILNQGGLLLTGVRVANNTANSGGGIATTGILTLVDSVVIDNTGIFVAGGILAENGGSVTLEGSSRVEDNQTTDSGSNGGGILAQGSATVTLRDTSLVTRNTSRSGAGIDARGSSIVRLHDDSRVEDNTATGQGGGIAVDSDSRLELHERSVVTLNDANPGFQSGGGIITFGGTVLILDLAQVTANTPDNCEPNISTPSGTCS
jgi:predicted outer membrane repeat protein